MALTATANDSVIKNIIDRLNIPSCVFLKQSFNRPNLHYDVREKKKSTVLKEIAFFIKSRHAKETGIIYCLSRKECESVAQTLRDKYGLKAQHYHAGMKSADKKMAQEQWQSGAANIIVSTVSITAWIVLLTLTEIVDSLCDGHRQGRRKIRCASYYAKDYGWVGFLIVDSSTVFIIHLQLLPRNRACRSRRPSRRLRSMYIHLLSSNALAHTFYSPVFYSGDATRLMEMIKKDPKSDMPLTQEDETRLMENVRQVGEYCMNISQCRRVQVLRHFDEVFHERDCHKRCDVCTEDAQVITRDVTIEAIDAVDLVKSMLGKNTLKHCKAVFLGSKQNKVKEKGHNELLGHGKGSGIGPKMVDQLFGKLIAMEVLHEIPIANRSGFFNYYLQVSGGPLKFLKHYIA
jgi:superfamily II DNA helicase RecQ